MASDKRQRQAEDDIFDWFTVSYRTIYIAVGVVLLAGGAGWYAYLKAPPTVPPTTEANIQPTPSTAQFVEIQGAVQVKPVGQLEWLPADKSMALKRGDLVRTKPASTAEIRFIDGTTVHIRPDSLITIQETSSDPRTRRTRVDFHVSSGEVNFQTPPSAAAGGSVEASTNAVRTTVGADTAGGIVVASDTQDTQIKVARGQMVVSTRQDQRVELSSSQAVTVDAAGRAGMTVVLPGIPVLVSPPHQTEISYPDPPQATTLMIWKAVNDAAGYHLMLDFSPHFNRPIVDQRGIRNTTQELRGLEQGKYYWRVAAVDRDGNEGSFSEFSRFTVSRPSGTRSGDGPPPPLAVEGLDLRGNILQIKGRTEAGATVTVNDERVAVQHDGTFNEFIPLNKPGRQDIVVRAVGINGGVRVVKRTVTVTF